MTKKEIVYWLENKKAQKLNEKNAEIRQKKKAIYKTALEPLGFYEMADQIKEHLQQALEIWNTWKKAQDGMHLGLKFYNHYGFERQVSLWLESETSFAEMMEEHDITLSPSLFDDLEQEKNKIYHNISSNYNKVISAVYAAKNAKEAKTYLEGLGFDLSELEQAPENTVNGTNIDTSFLFLEKAA